MPAPNKPGQANVGAEVVEIHWDCELADGEVGVFQQLAECLGYLGRYASHFGLGLFAAEW